MNFSGKLALVTGGASGIGAACARFFAGRGARVVIADRNGDAAREAAEAIGALSLELDIADEAAVRRAQQDIANAWGQVDILVNCAGVLQRTLPPDQLSMKEWDLVNHIDLRGTYLCCAVFGAAMALRGRGAIVNIASVAGMRSGPLHAYGPAKAAVISLTECLAAEWGPSGVRVNAVSPGFTRTPALDKGVEKKVMDIDHMARSSAFGRLVEADEIAAAVGFLASDLASGMTGANLPVDAGYLVATPWMSYGGLRNAVAQQ
jgi:NAD(P)-dependent dehydrogenase (short-subunit alcohol dehydrogenase family)